MGSGTAGEAAGAIGSRGLGALGPIGAVIGGLWPGELADGTLSGQQQSTSSEQAECEKECDLEWDRNKFLCDAMAGTNHGFKSKAYKTCLERIDRIYIECIQECAKGCN